MLLPRVVGLRLPLLLVSPSRSASFRRASSSSSSTAEAAASIALAHGIELPGASVALAGAERGVGLFDAPSSLSSSLVAARVPLSLALSCDASLVSRGACGPPPGLTGPLRRLLPEGGCCEQDEADDGVAWELRLAALQLWACGSGGGGGGQGGGRNNNDRHRLPLPEPHARARSLWSAWRACGALPAKPPSLLCWSDRELAALGDDALAAAAAEWRAEARRAFDTFGVAALCRGGDFGEYLWAVSAVASRAFALTEDQQDEEEEQEGEGRGGGGGNGSSGLLVVGRAAVPLIDLANHGSGSGPGADAPNCRVRLVERQTRPQQQQGRAGDAFVELVREEEEGQEEERGRPLSSPAAQGGGARELLISYGPDKPSRVLMERYGFFSPGGAASDRIDWREVVAAADAAAATDALAPVSSSSSSSPSPAPPLARADLRRVVLAAGGLVDSEGGGENSTSPPPPPLSRAALAAAEARVVAALEATDGARRPFERAHVARAAGSVARLFGWRNAEEFRRARGEEADERAREVGGALAAAAARAAKRRRRAREEVSGDDAGQDQGDPERLALAAAYRQERARLLLALEAIGQALAAAAG